MSKTRGPLNLDDDDAGETVYSIRLAGALRAANEVVECVQSARREFRGTDEQWRRLYGLLVGSRNLVARVAELVREQQSGSGSSQTR